MTTIATTAGYSPYVVTSSGSPKKRMTTWKSVAESAINYINVGKENIITLSSIIDTAGRFTPMVSTTSTITGQQTFDELDIEIANMSEEEILSAILASAGAWADRADLDDIMTRRDRIDELYDDITPKPPYSPI